MEIQGIYRLDRSDRMKLVILEILVIIQTEVTVLKVVPVTVGTRKCTSVGMREQHFEAKKYFERLRG